MDLSKRPPLFITFEGIDGCGKTTQARLFAERLTDRNVPFIQTREPGGSPFAETLRDILLGPDGAKIPPLSQALLMTAARQDHVHNTIKPALARGEWVLCDRFIDSTTAYQGYGLGLSLPLIQMLHQEIGFLPDLTFIFSLAPEIAAQRRNKRQSTETSNHLDTQEADFYTRAHHGFQKIAAENTNRCHLIPAEDALDDITGRTWRALEGFIQKNATSA